MLRLQTEAVALLIDPSLLARDRAIEKVARVELQSRLGGRDVERATGRGIDHARGVLEAFTGTRQDEVVVVAEAVPELRMLFPDALADCRRFAEVECSGGHRCVIAAGKDPRVDRRIAFGADPKCFAWVVATDPS